MDTGADIETAATQSPEGAPTCVSGPKRIAHYTILREVGAGGMGAVYEARDEKMNRRVALKVLSRHHSAAAQAERRFEHEAWIGGRLDHPNLVKVYDRGEWEELSYFTMEFLEGGSLHDVILNMKRWGRDDRLGLEFGSREYIAWAIRQVIAAAHGLEHAHRKGVIHRDIKPMNLLLDPELGAVKIADFGVALDLGGTRLTSTGALLGTVSYMAPEQVLGRNKEIGPATDVYALGVTLFEMLTLDLPYVGQTQQLYLNAVLTSAARRPSKLNQRVGRDLEVVIGKALEKDARDRYQSAADFAEDLENVLHFRPISAKPPSAAGRIARWARRRPAQAALVAVILAAAPVIAVLGARSIQQRQSLEKTRIAGLLQEVRQMHLLGRFREVIGPASEVLARDPANVHALRNRATAQVELALATTAPSEKERFERSAFDDLARLAALDPNGAGPHHLRALVLARLGRTQEAEAAHALAETKSSAAPSADELMLDAWIAEQQRDDAQAVALLSRLIEQQPMRPDAFALRARVFEKLGQKAKAESDLRVAVGLSPYDAYHKTDLGIFLTLNGALDEGEKTLRDAVRLGPDNPLAFEALSKALLERGKVEASAGRPDAALSLFQQAEQAAARSVELDPDLPWAHVNLGLSIVERARLAAQPDPALLRRAAAEYKKALSACSPDPAPAAAEACSGALVNSCDVLIESRDLAAALPVCQRVAELQPGAAVAFYNLAGVHALAGRPEQALLALEKDFELGDRDWQYLARDRWFDSLQGDARFQGLIARMKSENPGN